MQGYTHLNYEHNEGSIISETVQIISIKFVVKIVRLQVYIIFSQFDDLALLSRSQLRLKLKKCLTCTIIAISRTFKLGMTYLFMLVSMTLTLMQVLSGLVKAKIQC